MNALDVVSVNSASPSTGAWLGGVAVSPDVPFERDSLGSDLLTWLREAPAPLCLERGIDLAPGGRAHCWLGATGEGAERLHLLGARAALPLGPVRGSPPRRAQGPVLGVDFGYPVVHQEVFGRWTHVSGFVVLLRRVAARGLGLRLVLRVWSFGAEAECAALGARAACPCEPPEKQMKDHLSNALPLSLELLLDRAPARAEAVALSAALAHGFGHNARYAETVRPALVGDPLLSQLADLDTPVELEA